MKKISLFLILAIVGLLAISACTKPSDTNIVGQGSDVSQNSASESNSQGTQGAQSGEFREFKMTAKQFEFSPSTIEVSKGDKVRLVVTSTDVPHGIAIREYGINEQLAVGKPVTIEFTADKEGTFTAYCSVACGAGHSSMKGKLIVK